jgi:hypothetical protein
LLPEKLSRSGWIAAGRGETDDGTADDDRPLMLIGGR